MSAYQVKDAVVEEINKAECDFICLNFANGDMVGHTGVNDAILKAIETVDKCVKEVVQAATSKDYITMIIADHGNSDYSANEDGSPNTAHSTNPVPCILVTEKYDKVNNGVLADVAPTLLKIMGLEIPDAMDGKALI
jgi:2,3-bisphosphoglycerate-independent phosphoglycerate mutase